MSLKDDLVAAAYQDLTHKERLELAAQLSQLAVRLIESVVAQAGPPPAGEGRSKPPAGAGEAFPRVASFPLRPLLELLPPPAEVAELLEGLYWGEALHGAVFRQRLESHPQPERQLLEQKLHRWLALAVTVYWEVYGRCL